MIRTERLHLRPASDDEMKAIIASQSNEILKQAYTEMLSGCLEHPDQRVWYAVWMMELEDGTCVGTLCFKGLDEDGIVELGYGVEPSYEGRGYETYFKLIIATGMRRGECCGLKWGDINYQEHTIHIQRNVVKVTGEEIIVKEPKTAAGDRYVYFSPEMGSLLKEYRKECDWEAEAYESRTLTEDDYVFRRHGLQLPMTPNSFTWRMKLILKKNGLPEKLNVHSLRHTNASLLIANGTDVATVAGLLGHSQPSTTLDIYTHAFDKNKKAASEVLQKGLEI